MPPFSSKPRTRSQSRSRRRLRNFASHGGSFFEKTCFSRNSEAVLKPEMMICPSGLSTRSASRSTSCGLGWPSSTWGSATRSRLWPASGSCSGSAASAAPGSRASEKRYGMRFCRRKSTSGRPICTARNPNTSSTALSNWASSQSRTYAPWAVDSHPESDERPPLYFCAPFCTKDCRFMSAEVLPQIVPISAFKDNYVWTLRAGWSAVVVDPGEARPVLEYLAREKLELVAILATHHHADHVGGISELVQKYPVPVYGPRAEPIAAVTRPVSGGDQVTIPQLGVSFSVLDIPGHTRA